MEEIKLTDIGSIKIGSAENAEAGTGITVLISETGMPAGLDVRGGGPASREPELLKPLAAASEIHAVVLSGGSAYGLDAAGGVMRFLEERGIGLAVGDVLVPLVCQSCLFDLTFGRSDIRPDGEMAYEACENAYASPAGNYRDGNYGAGCGATVGKLLDMEYCMKSGIGSYAVQTGDLKVGAVVAVNALGDVYDWRTGEKVAGLLNEEKNGFRCSEELMYAGCESAAAAAGPDGASGSGMAANTTIGAVITNAKFSKSPLCKIAGMAHDGYARCIRPIHTTMDGDSIYAVSVGDVPADQDVVGTLAAEVMAEAILRAVRSAETAGGCIAERDL